jgi:hypothetical protein
MEVGLYDAGYRHLHLDDCWAAKERNATGFPYPEIDHFPNGESAPAATSAEKPSSRSFGVARQRELAPYPSPSCPFFVSFHLAHRGSPLLVAGDRGPVSSAGLLRAAGMKPVIDYVHSKGNDGDKLVFGLYTCGGTKTCVGGRVGSENHWTQDAQAYAEWGVDWVKMDWCNSAPQDPRDTYPKMGKALNESGRHIAFNMCEWGKENPWEWGDSCAQSWRATGDHTGTWSSTKSIISEIMKIPANYSGRPYGWNDMDMVRLPSLSLSTATPPATHARALPSCSCSCSGIRSIRLGS